MTNWEDLYLYLYGKISIQHDLGAYGTREREAWASSCGALSAMLKMEALSRGIVKNFKPKNKPRFVT